EEDVEGGDEEYISKIRISSESKCSEVSSGTVWRDRDGTLQRACREGLFQKIHFILLFSRQGKLRLQKWYTTLPDKERKKITREIVQIILSRGQRTSSFIDWKELKLVYKRYASLYFCCAVENQDNELLTLEIVHRYVELLDKYFGNVCELDIIFNFEKAYFILDEFIMGGEIQETSKKSAVKAIEDSDMLQETMEEYMNKPAF
uniref:Adaptor related protein complex 1 subunit sigma 3 n=2 Tax=Laurasiatheria TaxID=314145 RepID=A0A4X1U6B3_PIG